MRMTKVSKLLCWSLCTLLWLALTLVFVHPLTARKPPIDKRCLISGREGWKPGRSKEPESTLHENVIHSSIFLNSSVPINIFKLYLSVSKPTNISLYSLVWAGHRRIYGSSGLTLTRTIYSSMVPCHRWIYVAYIHRWRGATDEYIGARLSSLRARQYSSVHQPI
jgi:hypothetical protein